MKKLFIGAIWLAGGGALVGLVFVFSFYTAMRVEMRSTQVEVPDLYGLDLAEAERASQPVDLVLEVAGQRNDPRVASGRVLEQTPRSGASVRRGRKVKLILSLGGRVLAVPSLVGEASRAVAIELQREGFLPGDEARVPSRKFERGQVMAQVPLPETTAVPNSRVHRLVSDGPRLRRWVMPDLTGRDRGTAEAWIERHGFRPGPVRFVAETRQPGGTVVAQVPLAGYPIRERDIVELTVAE